MEQNRKEKDLKIDPPPFFVFSRQGFSVALEAVLELALVAQAGLELRDPPATAS